MRNPAKRVLDEGQRLATAGDAASAAAKFASALPALPLDGDGAGLHERCLKGLSIALVTLARFDELRRALAAARKRYAAAARPDLEALALLEVARLEINRRRARTAVAAARSAVRLARVRGDPKLEGDGRLHEGFALYISGRYLDAERALLRCVASYRKAGVAPETLERPLLLRGIVRDMCGDAIAARRAHRAALERARRSGSRHDEFQALFLLADIEGRSGRDRPSRRYAVQAVRVARESGHRRGEARALQVLADIAAEAGHIAWAEQTARRAAEIGAGLSDPELDALASLVGAMLLGVKGRLREALAGFAEAGEAFARTWRAIPAQSVRAKGATFAFRAGDLGEARRAIDDASPELVAHGMILTLVEAVSVLADIHAWLGRPDRSRDEVARARRIVRSCRGYGYARGLLLLAFAGDLRRRGRRKDAAAALERAGRLLARTARVEHRIDLGLEVAAQADPERARATLARLERRARAARHPWPLSRVLLEAGRLAMRRGEAAAARRVLEEALAIAVAHGFRLVEVGIREALAEVAEETGNTADAAGLRERAAALRRECGAAPPGGGGPLRLTRREREVATLVCAGLLNKEIAARLGLAEVTVKNHIKSIFARTGARNRADLVRLKLSSTP